ncbi:hypothetical protein BU25DRAFT_461268 [Macroventuria anomochaeta]|uniref:Uncharacterized protein n=1 Tax=Macroventuria anomochaeta TaxID=301207 RepID=A0ACB6RTF3_9PLEO|nr:uncharacterized protein BU25DRAFT_461268 [Macroventuria anomochaeta]KAF2624413.1 hypothetical protein BU25DRAFT_461268 [Macroventuria anomochaeta]
MVSKHTAKEGSPEGLQAPSSEDSVHEDSGAISDADVAIEALGSSFRTATKAQKRGGVDEEEPTTLGNGSRSTLGYFAHTVSTTPSSPASATSTKLRLAGSQRVTREEQDRARAEYLQAQGFPVGSSTDASSRHGGNPSVSTKVQRLRQRLASMPGPHDALSASTTPNFTPELEQSISNPGEAHDDVTSSRSRRSLQKFRIRMPSLRGHEHGATASTPTQDATESNVTFKALRSDEAGNWFTVRGSKTLPHRFEPPESLQDASSSPRSSKDGRPLLTDYEYSKRFSRSASLRLRNLRLPPAYTLPIEPTSEIVPSASVPKQDADDREAGHSGPGSVPEGLLGSVSQLMTASLIPNIDEDDDVPASLAWSTRRSSHDLTIDTTISDGLPSTPEALTAASQRNSRFSEVLEDVDPGTRPDVPPRSPDRPSARNSALLSNRGSVVFPVPEPAESLQLENPAELVLEKKQRSWWIDFLLVVIWVISTALTMFGMSNTSLLHQPLACTLGNVQTCTPPSFSFVHNLRLNTTLPEVLWPFISTLRLQDVEGLDLADHGLVVKEIYSDTQTIDVHGGLVVRSAFSDRGINLLSDIIYSGVVDGGDIVSGRKLLQKMLKKAKAGHGVEEAVGIVSAQGARENASRDGSRSIGDIFLALWLACLLAVEITLLVHFAMLPVLWMAAVWLSRCCWSKKERNGLEKGRSWKQEVLMASGLALRWILAGALGSAGASGILLAFWT